MFLGKDFNKETFIENNPFHFCRLNWLLKGFDKVAPLKRSIDPQISNLLVAIILFLVLFLLWVFVSAFIISQCHLDCNYLDTYIFTKFALLFIFLFKSERNFVPVIKWKDSIICHK